MLATPDDIAKIIYDNLNYAYCDNCRYNSEVNTIKVSDSFEIEPCEDCFRKYQSWAVSYATAKRIAEEILKLKQ